MCVCVSTVLLFPHLPCEVRTKLHRSESWSSYLLTSALIRNIYHYSLSISWKIIVVWYLKWYYPNLWLSFYFKFYFGTWCFILPSFKMRLNPVSYTEEGLEETLPPYKTHKQWGNRVSHIFFFCSNAWFPGTELTKNGWFLSLFIWRH